MFLIANDVTGPGRRAGGRIAAQETR